MPALQPLTDTTALMDAHAVKRECLICGKSITTSHLPVWLYQLKSRLTALNLKFNPVLCMDCHSNHGLGLVRVAIRAIMEEMSRCQRNQL